MSSLASLKLLPGCCDWSTTTSRYHLSGLRTVNAIVVNSIYQRWTKVEFFMDINLFTTAEEMQLSSKWVDQPIPSCSIFKSLHCCPVNPQFVSLTSSLAFPLRHPLCVHSELGEAAESTSSFSRSLGEDDCPPFTRFHFILLFWNHTFTWGGDRGYALKMCDLH